MTNYRCPINIKSQKNKSEFRKLDVGILQFVCLLLLVGCDLSAFGQNDSTKTSQDAAFDRPFINVGKTNTAIGGYVEGNTNYFSEDGISEGYSMELRRFNFFLYSSIHKRVKFISEVEFEHGTEEIALELAQLDFEFNPSLNFRAGILLPQIGMINANHDSPKWEFIERPLSSTEIIPSTLSEVGFGFHGKFFPGNKILAYDAYLVNGLQDGIILNSEGRTHLASGKSIEMFEEDNNGTSMLNAKIFLANRRMAEVGISYYGGIYNRYNVEGNVIDEKRMLAVAAFDFSTKIKKLRVFGEFAYVSIDVPADIQEIYGTKQLGTFLELSYPVLKRTMLGFENAVLNVNLRGEKTDYNMGTYSFNGSRIGDEVNALSLGIGFRPTSSTVIRTNYRYHWIYDALGNPPAHLGAFQVGVASYF